MASRRRLQEACGLIQTTPQQGAGYRRALISLAAA
jgi:hypothetical protein